MDYLIQVLQALTCFPPQPGESIDDQWALTIYPYFLFISSLFLVATFVVYAILPEIRNMHGVTIMCHVASLAVMYMGMGIIQLCSYMPHGLCITMGQSDDDFHLKKKKPKFVIVSLNFFDSCGYSFRIPLNLHLAERDEFRHLLDFQVCYIPRY